MIHVPRLATLVVTTFFLGVVGQCDVSGSCESVAEDDIEGYTSLLQTSLNLAPPDLLQGRQGKGGSDSDYVEPHRSIIKKPRAAAPAWISDNEFMWMGIGSFLFLFVFYFTCLRPALAMHQRQLGSPRSEARRRSSALTWIVNDLDSQDEVEHRIHDSLDEDTYSLAIALMVRDLRSLALGEGKASLKHARIMFAVFLVFLTIGIQVGVVACTKQFVTPLQVAEIRDAYDKFEEHMYNGNTEWNKNGKQRGIKGFFNASAFADLSNEKKWKDEDQKKACNIPFSQLNFFVLILFVWSVTCMRSIQQCFEKFTTLIIFAETKESMGDSMVFWSLADFSEDDLSVDGTRPSSPRDNKVPAPEHKAEQIAALPIQVITGLTLRVKMFFVFCIFIPELLTTAYILWLGSRWLTATNDFGNIVSNAVALEFTLQLKCLLFYALASERNKRDLAFTGIAPPWGREAAGYGVYFSTMYWIVLSVIWVYMYVFHFQQVLPDYRWDVHQVCTPWLLSVLKASGGPENSF